MYIVEMTGSEVLNLEWAVECQVKCFEANLMEVTDVFGHALYSINEEIAATMEEVETLGPEYELMKFKLYFRYMDLHASILLCRSAHAYCSSMGEDANEPEDLDKKLNVADMKDVFGGLIFRLEKTKRTTRTVQNVS